MFFSLNNNIIIIIIIIIMCVCGGGGGGGGGGGRVHLIWVIKILRPHSVYTIRGDGKSPDRRQHGPE